MTDHYAEAEKDIAAVNDMYAEDILAAPTLARAQIHATLALADAIRDRGAVSVAYQGGAVGDVVAKELAYQISRTSTKHGGKA